MEHHARGLRRQLIKSGQSQRDSDQLVQHLIKNYQAADLPDVDRAILDYSAVLTREPASVATELVDRLRECGLDDRAIHDLCSIVAYFAFANRIANGLGIELEEE